MLDEWRQRCSHMDASISLRLCSPSLGCHGSDTTMLISPVSHQPGMWVGAPIATHRWNTKHRQGSNPVAVLHCPLEERGFCFPVWRALKNEDLQAEVGPGPVHPQRLGGICFAAGMVPNQSSPDFCSGTFQVSIFSIAEILWGLLSWTTSQTAILQNSPTLQPKGFSVPLEPLKHYSISIHSALPTAGY